MEHAEIQAWAEGCKASLEEIPEFGRDGAGCVRAGEDLVSQSKLEDMAEEAI
jgi:hypothetical protein